jgi:hypothetical protein
MEAEDRYGMHALDCDRRYVAGNGESDVGKTLDATVRDGTVYSRSVVLPAILIGLGAPFLVPVVGGVKRAWSGRQRG